MQACSSALEVVLSIKGSDANHIGKSYCKLVNRKSALNLNVDTAPNNHEQVDRS